MAFEDEIWDESIMGPNKGSSTEVVLKSGDVSTNPNTNLSRSHSSGSRGSGPPPTSMFMTAIQSADAAATVTPPAGSNEERRQRPAAMLFEDDNDDADVEDGPQPATPTRTARDSARIRQEALRMLEVADDQLADSNYSVYRTKTGGYTAMPRSMEDTSKSQRTPAALSGFSFATSRKNVARPFRDDPYADTDAAPASQRQEDYEYGDTKAVVDVQGMDQRSAATRPAEDKGSWSSRYSIDHTMLALSGGMSSSKMLDKMDKEHTDNRRAARNLFASSPAETKSAQVFGSGFSFRQKHVFGQQGVTSSSSASRGGEDTNLKSLYMDDSPEEVVNPARSWQEEFQQKRRTRRNFMIAVGVMIVAVIVIGSMSAGRGGKASSDISDAPAEDQSITFYVTSDVPLSPNQDGIFNTNLQSMSSVAEFMVHLGDIQRAEDTQCEPGRYKEVAALLKASPILAMIVPGEEDWANCPDQEAGWKNWQDSFYEFERYFDHPFNVLRFEDQMENFAFVLKNVLFIGVHETNGRIDDRDELASRNLKNVEWIRASYEFHKTQVRAMVIFANGRPALRVNDSFYLRLGEFLFQNKVPTAYIHSSHDGDVDDALTYAPYKMSGLEHVIAIQSTRGESHPPLRVNVGFDTANPFIVG